MRPVLARGQNDKGFSSGANKAWRARNRVHRLPEDDYNARDVPAVRGATKSLTG